MAEKYLIDKESFNLVEGTEKTDFDNHTHAAADIVSGTLAVERGGTGAANAADARTNLGAAAASHTHNISDILGAISFTQLWQNDDPEEAFAGQTIYVEGMASYNLYLIVSNDPFSRTHLFYVPNTNDFDCVMSDTYIQNLPAGYFECTSRSVTFVRQSEIITFSNGNYGSIEGTNAWTPSTDNTVQVPWLILGANI